MRCFKLYRYVLMKSFVFVDDKKKRHFWFNGLIDFFVDSQNSKWSKCGTYLRGQTNTFFGRFQKIRMSTRCCKIVELLYEYYASKEAAVAIEG